MDRWFPVTKGPRTGPNTARPHPPPSKRAVSCRGGGGGGHAAASAASPPTTASAASLTPRPLRELQASLYSARAAAGSTSHSGAHYRAAKQKKLNDQAAKAESDIFRNVCVYVNGYLGPGVNDQELKRLVTINGGSVSSVKNMKVTHLVCTNLSGSKTHSLLTKRRGHRPNVVTPAWVYASVARGKRVAESGYPAVGPGAEPFRQPRAPAGGGSAGAAAGAVRRDAV